MVLLYTKVFLLRNIIIITLVNVLGLDISKHNEPAYPAGGWAIDYPVQVQHNNSLKKSKIFIKKVEPKLKSVHIKMFQVISYHWPKRLSHIIFPEKYFILRIRGQMKNKLVFTIE